MLNKLPKRLRNAAGDMMAGLLEKGLDLYLACARTCLAVRNGWRAYFSVPFLKVGCLTPVIRVRRVMRTVAHTRKWDPWRDLAAS